MAGATPSHAEPTKKEDRHSSGYTEISTDREEAGQSGCAGMRAHDAQAYQRVCVHVCPGGLARTCLVGQFTVEPRANQADTATRTFSNSCLFCFVLKGPVAAAHHHSSSNSVGHIAH